MHTFRSMLKIRRKTKGNRTLHAASKACIEGLEWRLLLSATTTTAVSPSTNATEFGFNVALTATVTPNPANPNVTDGDLVNFLVNGQVAGTSGTVSGVAIFPTSTLPAGVDSIQAVFTGNLSGGTPDPNFLSSTSAASQVEVTSIVVSAVPANTASVTSPGTVTATIVPANAAGTVTFTYGASNPTLPFASNVVVSGGTATASTAAIPAGSWVIAAAYTPSGADAAAGSADFVPAYPENITASSGATASMTSNVTALPANTTTISVPVTLSATVSSSSAIPNGETVTFFNNGNLVLGTGTTSNGVATTAPLTLAAGSYSITAMYSGDPTFAASSSPSALPYTVTGAGSTATTTTLTVVPPNTSQFNTPVTLNATVSPAPPDGDTVTFSDGGALPLGIATTMGGVATLSNVILPAGMDNLTATYAGDPLFLSSTSSPATSYSVTPATPTNVLSTASPASVPFGTAVTFTDTVTPASAMGTVNFFDNGMPLGAGMQTSPGVYQLTVARLSISPNPIHNITAMFVSSVPADYSNSAPSNTVTETITPAVATVNLASATNPAPFLSTITFTATVNGIAGVPLTGMVIFMDGATPLGQAAVVSAVPGMGVATLNVPSSVNILGLQPNPLHNVTATYSGDPNFSMGIPSNTVAETIIPAVTTTTLATSNPSPAFGVPITLTATVAPTILGGPPLAGSDTVTFFDTPNGAGAPIQIGMPVTLANISPLGGTAILSTGKLPFGTDVITATFNNGDANYATSTTTNPPLQESVGVGATTTFLSVVPAMGTIMLGAPVILTATVSPAGAAISGGTVSFFDNGNLIAGSPVTISAMTPTAVLATTGKVLGNNDFTAIFTPAASSSFGGSSSPAVSLTIGQATSTTALFATPPTAAQGAPVTFTTTVLPTNLVNTVLPTGTVTFVEDGTTTLGTVMLTNGTAILTSTTLALGTDTITATYSGDLNYTPSAAPAVTEHITGVTSTTSTTTIATSINPIAPGDSVTFTASVVPALGTGATPTGNVTFFDGATPIATAVALNNGLATFTTTTLPSGTNYISASYNGGNYSASSSAPLSEIVGTATAFITSLNVSNNSVIVGTAVTLVANVSPPTTGGMVPSGGSVTFLDGATSLGSVPLLSNDTAAITITLPAGAHPITASYTVGSSSTASPPIVVMVNSPTIPSIDGLVIPPDVVAGLAFRAKVPVLLANVGAKVKGKFIINVFANIGTTLDGNQVLLTTMTKNLVLNANRSRTINARLKSVPATLPAGTYNLLVQVVDPNGASNLGISTQTVGVLTPYVTLAASAGVVTPSGIAIGKSGSVVVTVTNTGDEPVSGVLNLTLSPSTDGVNPVPGITLAILNPKVKFQAGQTRKYRLHFNTAALAAGNYYPYLSVMLGTKAATNVGAVRFTIG